MLVKHYCFTGVKANIASIRELRTDFRSVKRKLEAHGTVVITDRGEPAYLLSPLPQPTVAPAPLPDYLSRLARRQPKALSAEETRRFWEEERICSGAPHLTAQRN